MKNMYHTYIIYLKIINHKDKLYKVQTVDPAWVFVTWSTKISLYNSLH